MLSTTRPRGMGAPGPISYREVMAYANDMELGPNSREFLWEVVKRVDARFLKLFNEKIEASRQQAKAGAKRS